jgi:prepilin-type N-terminal cleavage/methylation domain-containing protein
MAKRGVTLIELLVGIVLASILIAIASASAVRARGAAFVAVLASDLEALIRAEEMYFATSGGYFGDDPNDDNPPTYTGRLRRLEFTASPDVRIRIRANRRGWSARAEHTRRSDRFYCAVFVGKVRPYEPAEEEGRIECEPRRGRR